MMQSDEDKDFAEAANRLIDVSTFTRLTAVPRGEYDCYFVNDNGVFPAIVDISNLPVGPEGKYLSPEEDAALSEVGESLEFPCTAQRLLEWVKGTYGNFQLPDPFIKAVEETPMLRNSGFVQGESGGGRDGAHASSTVIERREEGGGNRPLTKLELRQEAILTWLKENNFDPLSMPRWKTNAAGAKAKLKKAMLERPQLFTESTFKKAWEALPKSGQFRYKD